MSSKKDVPAYMRAAPMTYEVVRAESLSHQRASLAANADELTADELRTRAVEAQFDVTGADTKEKLVATVRAQASGSEPTD